MKKTVFTLAAALLLGTSWAALAQEDPTLLIPGAGQQDGGQDQQPQKKRKKHEAEQPSGDQQFEQPQSEKKKRKKQAEQPDDSYQQPSSDQQFEQPQPERKKRKKQAEQPNDTYQQPSSDQQFEQPQPEKKRKKKQAEEPTQQQPTDQQAEQPQPEKKRKKKQAEEPTQQQSTDQQAEQPQPEKKRKKKQAEEPTQQPTEQQVEQPSEQSGGQQAEQPVKKKKKEQAQQPGDTQTSPSEQTSGEQKSGTPAAGNVSPEVTQYLSDSRPASELSDAELAERVKAGRNLVRAKGLSDDARQEVANKFKQARTEAIAREQGKGGGKAGKQPEAGQQTTEQPTETQPSTSEQTAGESKSDSSGASPEVSQYLSDSRPASELSDAELAERVKAGRNLVRAKGLSDDARQEVANKFKQARTEAMAREQGKGGGKAGKQPESGQQTTEQPTIGEPRKNAEGQEVVPTDEPGQPTVTLDKKDVEKFDSNKSKPQAEAKAKTYLDDNRRGDQFKDDELKTRLDGMRDLLSDNELSRDTKRELRRKLKEERDLYRNRVAEKVVVEERNDDQKDRMPRRRDRYDDRKWDNWGERDILRDRRRSDELEEGELRRRIDIYRIAIYDDRYSDDERRYWRDMMDRDRRYLGDRMRYDRGERERYWHDRRDRNEINIAINIDLGGDREPPPYAYLDEIDDEELEDYLVTAPRRPVARRYTVAEIEEEPEVRTAMPAIEVDNIHFGFNESFLREEEVQNLDRIAEVVEKVLAAHPDEVFMIEGHTDAVGSAEYNLKLSRERAQAVKKALTTYYVIPARNLVTVGYGERYLKIPTAEPEEENRRVSFRRVTPLVGEAE